MDQHLREIVGLGGLGGSEHGDSQDAGERLLALSRRLRALAAEQDELAVHEAWELPSWAPPRARESGHLAAAAALRSCARSLELEARLWGAA